MADRILAQELADYTDGDSLLEWQRIIPWINNFAQKKAKGTLDSKRAAKALGDYLTRDVYERYSGRGSHPPAISADTKLLFGQIMFRKMMPRITATAGKMKKVGLNKGKLVKEHPMHKGMY